jgi:hypothetical protein
VVPVTPDTTISFGYGNTAGEFAGIVTPPPGKPEVALGVEISIMWSPPEQVVVPLETPTANAYPLSSSITILWALPKFE